jgi:hypothetical protein
MASVVFGMTEHVEAVPSPAKLPQGPGYISRVTTWSLARSTGPEASSCSGTGRGGQEKVLNARFVANAENSGIPRPARPHVVFRPA